MELPALERVDRGCLRSTFLGSHHALAFVLLAVRMKICRCAPQCSKNWPSYSQSSLSVLGLEARCSPHCLERPQKVPH